VKTVVDVRELPLSRKKGFSKNQHSAQQSQSLVEEAVNRHKILLN